MEDTYYPESEECAVENVGNARFVAILGVAGGDGPGHKGAEDGKLVEDASLPGGIKHCWVIGDAISIGIYYKIIAVDILIEPGNSCKDIIEEAAVEHEVIIEDGLIGGLSQIFGYIVFGQVKPVGSRPGHGTISIDILEVVIIREIGVWNFSDGVDRSQDNYIGIKQVQLPDLVGGERCTQPEVDFRTIGEAFADKIGVGAPEVSRSRIRWVDLGQAAISLVQYEIGVSGTADVEFIDDVGVRVEAVNNGLVRGCAIAGVERGHIGKRGGSAESIAALGRNR